jgi:predicted kinase
MGAAMTRPVAYMLCGLVGSGKTTYSRGLEVDYGFWSRSSRERYKRLIEAEDASWRLLYLRTDLAVIRSRLAERNGQDDPNALTVDERMLEEFLARWEEPDGEGEEIVPVVAASALRAV